MPSFTRRTTLKALGATAAAWALPAGAQNAGPLKIGYIYVSPIGDAGWTHQHDIARIAMEKALAGKVTTKYVENVPEGADAERVIRELAQSGHKLIFTTSFGYMNPTLKVAQQFPNTFFEHATGYKDAKNMGRYNARFYEGRYLAGIVAGRMTRSNVAGYVAAFPIPEVVMGINAFHLAARKVNPNFKTKVVWCSTWYDPAKEADAAKALIDQGADMITQHTDSAAPLQAAEQRGVYAFGQASDMKAFAPKAHLSAIVDDWSGYYIKRVKEVMDGTWKSGAVWGGIKDGFVKLAPYNDAITPAARAAADAVQAGIVSGKLHPFTGELKDQKGEIRVKAGETASDEILSKMDWYVDGVQA
jgi:simple sugar transport system substrate-binding protein